MRKKTIYMGLLLGVLTLLLLTPDIAMAADSIEDILGGGSKSMTASDFSDKVIDFGKDINEGTSFKTEFQKIFLGMNTVFRSIITILTVAAGAMIAFGIEDGKKTAWQFMLTYVFKAGFFCFLIMEWLNIGQALSGFFQAAGFLAAGESGFSTVDPASADADTTFRPDSIWHNATAFLMLALTGKKAGDSDPGFGFWDAAKEAGILSFMGGVAGAVVGGPGALLGPIVVALFVLFIVGLMFFISVEMFVARIEFYTMLLLSVVFLPFGVTERLAFLSNSAISLMFNSGAKMMVISFLQVMIAKILSSYLLKLKVNPFDPSHLAVLCQLAIMCVFFAYITKKIPDLVSSFLNGSPALSGGGMISQAKGMATQTAAVLGTAGGAVAGASAASTAAKARHAASGKPTTMMSQLKNSTAGMLARGVAQNVMARNPLTQGYASGMKSMVGSDGSLQNEKFMKGVRQLAGLEANTGKLNDTKSLSKLASEPYRKQGVPAPVNHKTATDGKMPSGVSKRSSSSFSRPSSGVKGKVDRSGKVHPVTVAVGGGSSNPTERTAPIMQQPTGGGKEKVTEKEFRSESKHTASKEQSAVPGQNIPTAGNSGMGGGSQNISNMQQSITETKNQSITNNQQTKNIQGGSSASGKQPDGSMSQLNNYKK